MFERKQAIVHRYEKRIRRTHKVASQTEQSLKQQQSQLQTVKDELSRCIAKLEEKVHLGDNQALVKIKDAELRIQQVAKILPYLSKYIQVNKQAELQTVAILRESCRVELSRVQNGSLKSSSDSTGLLQTVSSSPCSSNGQIPITEQSFGVQPASAGDSRQIKVLSTVGNYARVEFVSSNSPQPQLKSVDYAKIDKSLLGSNLKPSDAVKLTVPSHKKLPAS